MVSLYLREDTFLDKLHDICHRLVVFFQACLPSRDNLGMLNGATMVLSQMKLQCDIVFYYHFVLSLSVFKDSYTQLEFNPGISFRCHVLLSHCGCAATERVSALSHKM